MKNHILYTWIYAGILMAFQLVNPAPSLAQAKLTATISTTSSPQNTAFTVTYSLSGGSAQSFAPPSFAGLSMIGTAHSVGGGMTVYRNGQKIQDGGDQETWTYTLMASQVGKVTIGAAKAKVNNQWVTSNTLSIDISKGTARQNQNTQTQSTASAGVSGNDLFIKAFADKTNVIQGEQVTVTYKIYTNVNIDQSAISKLPSFAGFWTYDLTDPNAKQHTETVNGKKYVVAEIRKTALFPQKSGSLTIDPLDLECIVEVMVKGNNNAFNSFFNDPFFSNNPFFQNAFSGVQRIKKTIRSNAVNINVAPLPDRDKPEKFSGGVGSFTFTADVDRREVKQNEAINLKLSVHGSGNISLIDLPTPEFPSDFEVYDPQMTEDIKQGSNPLTGSKTFEYLIIPRNAGSFTIKPFVFTYYDPRLKEYKNISAPGFTIKVAKGSGTSVKTGSQGDVELIGSDIRYSEPASLPLQETGYSFFAGFWFYLILLILSAAFSIFVIIWRRKIIINNNASLRKHLRATRVAGKKLKMAQQHLDANQKEMFFQEVSRALWGYVCDKFAIPLSTLSLDSVQAVLEGKNIREDILKRLIGILNQCEFARFAPAGTEPDMASMYKEAGSIIMDIEQDLNSQKSKKKI